MSERSLAAATYLCIAAAFAGLACFFLVAGMDRVLTVIPDDAAYYFQIARNVAAGAGATFDGLDRTNGFQPLWLALLVPLFRAVHGSPETMTRIALLVQLVMLAAAALVVARVLARRFGGRAAFVSVLLFLFFVFLPAANGMESAVLVLALAIALRLGSETAAPGRAGAMRDFGLGALLGLVMLARLDMVFLPVVVVGGAFAAALRVRGAGARALARPALLGAGAAAVVAPYLIWNLARFGALMPISGLLKSSFPRLSLSAYGLASLGKRGWAGLLCAAAYAAFYVARGRRGDDEALRGFRTALAAMSGAVLLHFGHAALFMKWAVFDWHYLPYVFFGTVAVCEPLARILSRTRPRLSRAAWAAAAIVVTLAGSFASFRVLDRPAGRDWRPQSYAAALWARTRTPPDAVFAMKDAGNFGYFSLRRVINLDGVVNDLEYQAALREKSLGAYLAVKGAGYLVQHAFWDRPDVTAGAYDSIEVTYRSHRFETDSDAIVLRRRDEVYRSRPYFDGPYETVFVIWKLGAGENAAGSVGKAVEVPVLVGVAPRAEEN